MTLSETLTLIAIIASPVIAVIITLWHQSRKEKRQQKFSTFFTLIAFRDATPIHPNFVTALNTVDIVFHDCPAILAAWKKYFENLNSDNSPPSLHARNHLKLDLLFEIAKHLGYRDWKQTDIDKYYVPIQHYDQSVLSADIQRHLLVYLKKSIEFYERMEILQNASASSKEKEN